MKFSILTPSYNQGSFLQKNIESVARQDVSGTQHIVVDGGSTDETVDVLKRNAGRLHYWVSERDRGQAHALNKALAHATNDIIGWLNVDEYYPPNIFGLVARAFERRPDAVAVYGNVRRVTADGRLIRLNHQWRFDYDVCRVVTPIMSSCATFFRRSRVVEVGGFDESWQYLMDWEFYIRLMEGGRGWVRLPQILGNFTMHEAAKTARAQEHFDREAQRLRDRVMAGLTGPEREALTRRQVNRVRMHMLMDGVLFEKIWFKLFQQRHYARYFGDPGVRWPILSRFLDWVSPVRDGPTAR